MPDAQEKWQISTRKPSARTFPFWRARCMASRLSIWTMPLRAKPVQVTGRMQRVFDSEYSNVHRGYTIYLTPQLKHLGRTPNRTEFLNAAAIPRLFSPEVRPMPLIWWRTAIWSRA